MIRVLLLSGIRLYREGLAQLLGREPTLDIVGTASNRSGALSALERLAPDVVLLDMVTDDSCATAHDLRHIAPDIQIVAVGIADSDREVVACVEMGASAYVTREGSLAELVAAIHGAAAGELICSPRTAGTLVRRLATLAAERDDHPADARLTQREREIAGLLQENLSNKEIAVRLRIQVATVKNHVHNLMEKLHIRRRTEAAGAIRHRSDARRPSLPGPAHRLGG